MSTKDNMRRLSTEDAARMCPVCGSDSRVYDSREQPDGSIVRRRVCRDCGMRFETVERFSKMVPKKSTKH